MASITFTTEQVILNQLIEGACVLYKYQPVIDGAPNPVSPGQFTTNLVISFCKDIVRTYQAQKAAEAARQAAILAVQKELDATPIDVKVTE